ncbi:class I SAM-dependent methyltransferase [Paracoccus pacificus]|uniref:Class I SAM-dependent methyltransferase n=1 Tax=Paracoccus pacificus TaxID=1463598 RepID=A0ABW4R8S2_9RHOB
MHHDVMDLRAFYYNRALGRVVQRILRDRLTRFWPPGGTTGMTVAGYGFAAPMLRPYLTSARRVTSLMPAPQGVMPWPAGMPNHSVLAEETAWPLDTGAVDRLVMLHGLETSDHPLAVLEEARRVLGPGGRMILIAPNRAGLWARSDNTPFGFGRSYTTGQLESQARAAGFQVERSAVALYTPPSDRRFWLRTADWWERNGQRISRFLVAGVVMIELSRQMQLPVRPGLRVAVPSPLDLLDGIARPAGQRGQGVGTPSSQRRTDR